MSVASGPEWNPEERATYGAKFLETGGISRDEMPTEGIIIKSRPIDPYRSLVLFTVGVSVLEERVGLGVCSLVLQLIKHLRVLMRDYNLNRQPNSK